MVAEAVVGGEVLVGDGDVRLLQGGGERFVGGAEAFVGGEDEDGAWCVGGGGGLIHTPAPALCTRASGGGDLVREGGEGPVGGVGLGFVGERGA